MCLEDLKWENKDSKGSRQKQFGGVGSAKFGVWPSKKVIFEVK